MRFDLDFSKHPFIHQSEPADREATYSMVKLYMLKKSQLVELAKHKNSRVKYDQLIAEVVNNKQIKIKCYSTSSTQREPDQFPEYDTILQVSMFSNVPVFVITNCSLSSGEKSSLKASRPDNKTWINGGRWIGSNSKGERASSGQRLLKVIEKRKAFK